MPGALRWEIAVGLGPGDVHDRHLGDHRVGALHHDLAAVEPHARKVVHDGGGVGHHRLAAFHRARLDGDLHVVVEQTAVGVEIAGVEGGVVREGDGTRLAHTGHGALTSVRR